MFRRPIVRAAVAGLAYFGIVFAIAFALGAMRVLVLIPRLGEIVAVLIELPILLGAAWVVCQWLIARFDVPSPFGVRLVMGGLAFAVLMLAEVCMATFGFGRSLSKYFEQYRGMAGMLGLAGQIAFAALPVVQSVFGAHRSAR